MKRSWNVSIWAGFLIVLAALILYMTVFVRFPATRDAPGATLLILGAGLALMARGLARAYRTPQLYRGRIAGPILMAVGTALGALFCFGIFYEARQLPPSKGAPRVGQKAPDFTLPDKDGNAVVLSSLLGPAENRADSANGVVLIFYRGFW